MVCALSITFECRAVGGQLEADNVESRQVRFFAPDNLPENLVSFVRERIEHAIQLEKPFFRMME